MKTIESSAPPQPVCACRRGASPASPGSREYAAESRRTGRARGTAAWALPSIALALVPKCPMCIAAYLAIGGGLGVSLSTAAHLRTALVWLCWSALAVLAVRIVMRSRLGLRNTAAARRVMFGVRREPRRSSARTAAA